MEYDTSNELPEYNYGADNGDADNAYEAAPGDIHPEDEFIDGVTDPYLASDIIPDDEIADQYTSHEAPSWPGLPERKVIPYTQVHLVDSQLLEGVHPEESVRQYIEGTLSFQERQRDMLDTILSDPACRDDSYAGVLATASDQLAHDFGPAARDIPLTLLSAQGQALLRKDILGLKPLPAGLNIWDRTIITGLEAEERALRTSLHEGAHANIADKRQLLITRPINAHDTNVTQGDRDAGHIVRTYPVGGFIEYNPIISETRTVGHAWEEGFADSYALRTQKRMGFITECDRPPALTGQEGMKILLKFVNAGESSYIDTNNHAIAVPWKYTSFLNHTQVGDRIRIGVTPSILSAYMVDLLDGQLPGLFDDMMSSRRDPTIKERIKERVDSLVPAYRHFAFRRLDIMLDIAGNLDSKFLPHEQNYSLYDTISGLDDHTTSTAATALLAVIVALDLIDKPVSTAASALHATTGSDSRP